MSALAVMPNLWREGLAIVLRRPRPSAAIAARYPDGAHFALVNGAVSSILMALVVVDLIGDVPMSYVIVVMVHPAYPLVVHLALLLLTLSTLVWVLAIRSAQRAMPHVVCERALWLGGGVRHGGMIPRAAIEQVQPIRQLWREWLHEQGIPMSEITLASGFHDPPNLALQLREDARAAARVGNRRRQKPPRRWLLIYADHPQALAQALAAA